MSTRFGAAIIALTVVLAATGVHSAPQARPGAKPPQASQAPPPAKSAAPASLLTADLLSGLALRNIGPALMSGRISHVASHPKRRATWYVAVGSGGVWKTENAGTTWTTISMTPSVLIWATSRSTRRTPKPCGSARARTSAGATSATVTASTRA